MPFDLLSAIADLEWHFKRVSCQATPGSRSFPKPDVPRDLRHAGPETRHSIPEVLMNGRRLISATRMFPVLALALATAAFAQGNSPVHFRGLINDYTASSVKGGPWEMHGAWNLDLRGASGNADFSADMTMSNYGTTNGVVDPGKPGNTPHVHHVVMKQRNCPMEHGRVPHLRGSNEQHHWLSDYRPGQFAYGQRAAGALRDLSSAIATYGLHHGS